MHEPGELAIGRRMARDGIPIAFDREHLDLMVQSAIMSSTDAWYHRVRQAIDDGENVFRIDWRMNDDGLYQAYLTWAHGYEPDGSFNGWRLN